MGVFRVATVVVVVLYTVVVYLRSACTSCMQFRVKGTKPSPLERLPFSALLQSSKPNTVNHRRLDIPHHSVTTWNGHVWW
jgi:hypothetical protein